MSCGSQAKGGQWVRPGSEERNTPQGGTRRARAGRMDERDEGIPLSVEFDAPELEEGFGSFSDPAHATLVEALGDDIPYGSFDSSAGDLQIELLKCLVVHHVHALSEVVEALGGALASSLVSWAGFRDRGEALSKLS